MNVLLSTIFSQQFKTEPPITRYTLIPAIKHNVSLLANNVKSISLSLASSGLLDCVYTKNVSSNYNDTTIKLKTEKYELRHILLQIST